MEENNKNRKLKMLADRNIRETIRIMENLNVELERIIKRIETLRIKIKK